MSEGTPGGEASRAGLFASLKGLFGTSFALVQNRLQLLGVELAEERLRLLSLVTYGAIALVCLSAGLVFFAVFLTVLFWDSHRLLALGIFSALFLGAGIATLLMAMSHARAGSTLFKASLAELAKDREALAHGNPARPR
ncbi:MAG: phage holin family protein [Rhodocyclales bacterium]|nr:phage holin family protein [Rhodocyclales bacterium]